MNSSVKITPTLKLLQLIVFASIILYFGKPIFVPISFSLLISFILYPICQALEKKGVPRGLAIGFNLLWLSALLGLIVYLLFYQFGRFINDWPALKQKLSFAYHELQHYIFIKTGVTLPEQDNWLKQTISQSSGNVFKFLKTFIYNAAINVVLLILIPILSGLILYSRERWVKVLYMLLPNLEHQEIRNILKESIHAYYNFIKGMGTVYIVVAILNCIGLIILGIPHAILFGCIASVLTFIPYVGILVASLLPITISWLTFDSIWYPIGVIVIFTIVQYLEANVIFPLAVSSRLSLNTFITIVVILIGGLLWGAAGMILFIPFIGIIKLIADRSEKLAGLSMLLGNGKIHP